MTHEDPDTFEAPLHAVIAPQFAADDGMFEIVCSEAPRGAFFGCMAVLERVPKKAR